MYNDVLLAAFPPSDINGCQPSCRRPLGTLKSDYLLGTKSRPLRSCKARFSVVGRQMQTRPLGKDVANGLIVRHYC